MAVIKAAKGGKSLGKAMDYVEKKAELTSGKDCPDEKEKALEQMQATKEAYGKEGGREHMHYIQSFEPGEVTPDKAHEIGKEWAEKTFPGHEAYIATHTDKDHTHNHVIVNTVNYENGRKIQVSPKDLERLKSRSDEICKEHGLSTIDRSQKRDRGEIRAYERDKYQTIVQGKSYIAENAMAVDRALEKSQGKGQSEFIKAMNEQGYTATWRGKDITFQDKEGHKVRASNLAKTFSDERFSREGIESTIARQREMTQEKDRQPEMRVQTVEEIRREAAQVGRSEEKIGLGIVDTLTGEKARQEAAKRELERKRQEQEKAKELSRQPKRKITLQRDDPFDRGR